MTIKNLCDLQNVIPYHWPPAAPLLGGVENILEGIMQPKHVRLPRCLTCLQLKVIHW